MSAERAALARIQARLTQAETERDGLREALKFYADPATYVAIGFFPDPPCGAFMEDFGETDTQGWGSRPGERARAALSEHESTKPPLLTPGGRDLRAEYESPLRCTGIVPKTAIRCRLTAAHKGRCLPLSPLHETFSAKCPTCGNPAPLNGTPEPTETKEMR